MEKIVFITVLGLLLFSHNASNQLDLTEETGCHDTEFRLGCDSLTEKIVIFNAVFMGRKNDSWPPGEKRVHSCDRRKIRAADCRLCDGRRHDCIRTTDNPAKSSSDLDFRPTINRRCSGVNYCSFVFKYDYHDGATLGPGDVIIHYACVDDREVKKTCNVKIDVRREGLARSPGYPSYYIGETTCRWTLDAARSQRVKITFLDLSLRSIGPYESECFDWVVVSENGLNLLNLCGDLSERVTVYSQASTLNVTLTSNSKTMYPKRGFLFHYKAVGCPAVRKPEDGYLVDRNDTFVHFRCCAGFVFPDTLSRDKVLECYNENTWNGEMPDCVSLDKILEKEENFRSDEKRYGNESAAQSLAKMESTDELKDIILPSIIIVALFVGNAIVLYVIYRQRKKLANAGEKIEMRPMEGTSPGGENC